MDASVTSPVHTTKGRAPQRLHYCTTKHRYLIYNCKYKQVHQCDKGASENCLLMYTLYCFPAKRGLKRPENSQYLPKLVVKVQNFFILIHESQKFFVKYNLTACYFIVLGCPLNLYYSYLSLLKPIFIRIMQGHLLYDTKFALFCHKKWILQSFFGLLLYDAIFSKIPSS